MSRRRTGAALGLCAAAVLLLSSSPAGAQTGKADPVAVPVGKTVSVTYPGFLAPNEVALAKSDIQNESQGIVPEAYETPEQCDVDTQSCLDIPINLGVSDAVRLHHNLALTITVSYKDPVMVPNQVVTEQGQTLRAYLWKEHPGKDKFGNPIWVGYDQGNDPGFITAYQFPTSRFFLVVIPTRTDDQPFTVSYSLQDLDAQGFGKTTTGAGSSTPSGGSDAGAPDVAPPPAFSDPGTTVTTTAPIGGAIIPSAPLQPRVAQIVVPDISGGSVDHALLAASQVSLPNVLGKAGSANVTGATDAAASHPKDSAASLILIELLVLPVLVLLLALFLLARRRREQQRTSARLAAA